MSKSIMKFAALPLLSLLFFANAFAAEEKEDAPKYSLRFKDIYQESRSNETLSSDSPYPLKKRYGDFTPEEKAIMRAMYVGMSEQDEPPFPAAGMRYIIKDISDITWALNAKGFVSIHVNVGADGNPLEARVMNTPSPEVAKVITFVLMETKYKPAICNGTPCEMAFPFRFQLK